MIRAIRHYTGITGPDTYETRYETRDFSCPELEEFISCTDPYRIKNANYGFTGIEILHEVCHSAEGDKDA